jgi:two-component system, cell cycle sensor histidine kinase and response regulator CckA
MVTVSPRGPFGDRYFVSKSVSKKPTILFVEDDETFRYAACRHLEANGYSVVDVPSSMDALRVIDEGDIDVVIADIALYPKEPHGVALARMIRRKQPNIRILFVTGIKDIEQLEAEIPGEVLYKPVELATLSRKVQELLA